MHTAFIIQLLSKIQQSPYDYLLTFVYIFLPHGINLEYFSIAFANVEAITAIYTLHQVVDTWSQNKISQISPTLAE